MTVDDGTHGAREKFEISSRFRALIAERIERLERDADSDESLLAQISNADHVRRQKRLVAVQRAEALRMRQFLDHSGTRVPPPLITL